MDDDLHTTYLSFVKMYCDSLTHLNFVHFKITNLEPKVRSFYIECTKSSREYICNECKTMGALLYKYINIEPDLLALKIEFQNK